MSRVQTGWVDGFVAVQHHKYRLDRIPEWMRHVQYGFRPTDRAKATGDQGHWRSDQETFGDITGAFLWINEPGRRLTSAWNTHWPSMIWTRRPSNRLNRVPGDGVTTSAPFIPGVSEPPRWAFPLTATDDRTDYARDIEFAREEPLTCRMWNRQPGGTIGFMADSTDTERQDPLFLHADPRLISVNVDGDPACSSLVYDLDEYSQYDPHRGAPLHSFWRVGRPASGCVKWTGGNVLAWQLGRAEKDAREGLGMVCESRDLTAVPGIAADDESVLVPRSADRAKGRSVIFAAAGASAGGPLDVGRSRDKHQIGMTRDGEPINALGLSIYSLFRSPFIGIGFAAAGASPAIDHDAPLDFDTVTPYTAKIDGPFLTRVHLRYDTTVDHRFGCGPRNGMWRWETGSFFAPIAPCETPTYTPTPIPWTPTLSGSGTESGGTVGGGYTQ